MDKFFNLENSSTNNTTNFIEEIDEEEIVNKVLKKINNQNEFIDDIIDNILDKVIYNLNEIQINKMERVENKCLNQIYDKFGIKKNINVDEPIDLVYTFVNYKDKDFMGKRENFSLKNLDPILLKNYKEEKKELFHDFLLNIEITKKNLPFIRNIYIITPTADILDDYDEYIIIPIEDIYCNDKFVKTYFRPNYIVKYLKNIKGLSKLFLFGNQDSIVIKQMKKEEIVNEIPVIYLQKKDIKLDSNTKNIEEYNTNIIFKEKFEIMMKMGNINQISIVRKDLINFTEKLFNDSVNIDFLLLQYFVGYFFYLYEIKVKNINIYSGFYSSVQRNMFERFNIIKNSKAIYFNINYLNNKCVHYYLHACLINLGVISNKIVKKIVFISKKNKFFYEIPGIERRIRDKVFDCDITINNNFQESAMKFGEILYLVFDDGSKYQNKKHIILEITDINCMDDIFYFMNIESKTSTYNIKIHYPKRFMQKLDDKFMVPLTKILNIENEDSGVKLGKIIFSKN